MSWITKPSSWIIFIQLNILDFFENEKKLTPRNKVTESWKSAKNIQERVRLSRPIQLQNPVGPSLK